ncbi:hypothetical protein LJ707_10610 [Mucilaginibacter sp. UR6-1]|uniref:hypothetical protein n=1 Tax=Mucilaginibacter sp. UR6-1 TaxID=1435643 RepID=UPI001E3A6C9D|nr:hypothetical protein [Mucilaginibacter sp. UR6-1]MCC8409384.1 hypothetical protein [Mucilaginibacter sp. UR6-1]
MKKLVLVTSVFVLMMAACKKDPADFSGYENIIASVDSYQPLVKGSYWVYAEAIGSTTDTVTKTLNGNTVTVNGVVYYEANVLSEQNGSSKEYYYSDGHSYYTRKQDALLGAEPVNFYYLVDTAKINTGWTGRLTPSGTIEGQEVMQVGYMKNPDTTRKVQGKDYSKVVSTGVSVSAKLDDGSYALLYTYNNYMVKGIGTIQTDVQQGDRLISTTSLVRYHIPEIPEK